MTINLRNWIRDGAGDPVNAATVVAYVSNTLGLPTSAVTGTISTEGSQGRWAFEGLADNIYDLSITSGTQIRWQRGAHNAQYYAMAIQRLLQLPNGTAGGPPGTFTGDTDLGPYRIGTDNVGVVVNGSKLLDATATALGVGVAGSARMHTQGPITTGDTPTTIAYIHTFVSGGMTDAGKNPGERVWQARLGTTDDQATQLFSRSVGANRTVAVRAQIIARRTGGTAGTAEDGAFYDLALAFKVNAAGTATSLQADAVSLVEHESQAGWNAGIQDQGGYFEIWVSGALNTNITWHAIIRTWEVNT